MSQPILLDIHGAIATVTFNRPHALNAVNLSMARALRDAAEELSARMDLRVIVLRGAGTAFMAGGDVQAFRGPPEVVRMVAGEILDHLHGFILQMQTSRQLVIGAVQGAAAGGGFGIALATDITICADTARFAPAYRLLGASPDCGCSFFLPQLAGSKKAAEMLFSGAIYSAEEALQLGLVTAVVPAIEFDAVVCRMAVKIAEQNASSAAAATKALLKRRLIEPLREHLAEEKRAFLECVSSEDFSEGVRAFIDKRRPIFSVIQ